MKDIKSFITESQTEIEPTLENLKKALKICADKYNAEFEDWSDEGEIAFAIEGDECLIDVASICQAFFGNHKMVNVIRSGGYTVVSVDEGKFLPKIDMPYLRQAIYIGNNC